jgi:PAS domain S-box-containing protein
MSHEKEMDARVMEAEGQFQSLVEHLPAMLYVEPPSVSDKASYISPQSMEILGVSPEEWAADAEFWENHLHPEDRDRVLAEYESFIETGQPDTSEYRMIRPDGRVIWIHEVSMIVRDDQGKQLVIQGALFDITKRKEAEENIAFLAYHDPLTGLANRKLFEEMLSTAIARARRRDLFMAVLFMDLDDFKQVNDSLGHDVGDLLLKEVSRRLQTATRETDVVARQGGDEFLVLISDVEGEGAPGRTGRPGTHREGGGGDGREDSRRHAHSVHA